MFPTYNHLYHARATLFSTPQPPGSSIEVRWKQDNSFYVPFRSALIRHTSCSLSIKVLLFPALSFVQAGRLSSLELVTQELNSQIHARFQTYRPRCHYSGHHLLLPSESSPETQALTHFCGQHQQVLAKKSISHLRPLKNIPAQRNNTSLSKAVIGEHDERFEWR